MRHFPYPIAAMLTALAINGCASSSETIEATYVSPMKYESNSCAQVEQEYDRILVESNAVSKKQDDIADNDSVAMGVGLILFWPALFFIESDDHREEVARLKGEINAIEEASVKKDCTGLVNRVRDDREEARKLAEEKKQAQQEEVR